MKGGFFTEKRLKVSRKPGKHETSTTKNLPWTTNEIRGINWNYWWRILVVWWMLAATTFDQFVDRNPYLSLKTAYQRHHIPNQIPYGSSEKSVYTHLNNWTFAGIHKQSIQIVVWRAPGDHRLHWIQAVRVAILRKVLSHKYVFILELHVWMFVDNFVLRPNVMKQTAGNVQRQQDGENCGQKDKYRCPRANRVLILYTRIASIQCE